MASGPQLQRAVFAGDVVAVQRLLSDARNPVNVDWDDGDRATPLFIASQLGNVPLVTLLLEKGAGCDKANNNGFTPLCVACQNGHADVVRLLLEKGHANTEMALNDGWTPLLIASHRGHVGIVNLLLDKGAVKDAPNNHGATPLYIASETGRMDVVKALLRKGASTEKANNAGATPLYIASQKGYVGIVKALLKKGARADHMADGGWTPLLIASQEGQVDVVKALLASGASIEAPNKNGATALFKACQNGHIGVVKVLLETDANVDAAEKDGWTPLHIACQQGHLDIVRLLVENGADLTAVSNIAGHTARDIAKRNNHTTIVSFLQAAKQRPRRAGTAEATEQPTPSASPALSVAVPNAPPSPSPSFGSHSELDITRFIDWSVEDVTAWLARLKVSDHAIAVFRNEHITGRALEELAGTDALKELGITAFGDRVSIAKEIRLLLSPLQTPPLSPTSAPSVEEKKSELQLVMALGDSMWKAEYKGATVLVKRPAIDPTQLEDLDEEYRGVKSIPAHANLVNVLGMSRIGSDVSIVFEFCDLGSLDKYMQTHRDLGESGRLDFAAQIACGLAHLHAHGIVHREVSASNVLLRTGESGVVLKVKDFAFSRVLRPNATTSSDRVGMSPETAPEVRLTGAHTRASDVWSYGVLLWEIESFCDVRAAPDRSAYPPLPRPASACDALHTLMAQCWVAAPSRPTFADIYAQLMQLQLASAT